jgi:ankyrin repeat protein
MPSKKIVCPVKSVNEEISNSAGITPTMFAAQLGRKGMIELFLTKGCNPHRKCNKGKTALDYAVEAGHTECEEVLRTAMANTAPPSEKQKTDIPVTEETKKVSVGTLFDRLYNLLFGSKKAA